MSKFNYPNRKDCKGGLDVEINPFADHRLSAAADQVLLKMRATKVSDVFGVSKDDKILACGTKLAEEALGITSHEKSVKWNLRKRSSIMEIDLTTSDSDNDDEDNEFGSDIVMSETPSPEDLDGRSRKVDYLSSKGENGSEWPPDPNHMGQGGANDVVSVDESFDWDPVFSMEKVTDNICSPSSSSVQNRNEKPSGDNLESESLFNSDECSELPDVYYDPEDDASSFGSATTLSCTPPHDRLKDVEDDFSLDSFQPAGTDVPNSDFRNYDFEINSPVHASPTIKNKSEQFTEKPLPIPVTETIVGRTLEAAISPFVHQDNLLWLAKLKGNSGIEIVPGFLMNRSFPQDVIKFYEQRLNFDLEQPAVILSIDEIDASPYLKKT